MADVAEGGQWERPVIDPKDLASHRSGVQSIPSHLISTFCGKSVRGTHQSGAFTVTFMSAS